MQPFKFVPVALIGLTLAGCASIPELGDLLPYRQAPSDAALQSFETDRQAWPDEKWWLAYHDAQLTALINEALARSPDIESAAARLRNARAVEEQAGGFAYPDISARGSLQKSKQSYYNGIPANFVPHGFQNTARATIDLNYQLDFWGRNRDRLSAAISDTKAAALNAQQAKLILTTSIGEAYGHLIQSYAALDAAQNALAIRTKSVKLIKERLDNGLENNGGYDRQLAARSSAEADIEMLKEQVALNKNRLAALSGAGPERALAITRPKAKGLPSFGLPRHVPAALLGRRPDILAAKYMAQASEKRIAMAKTAFYPNIDLTASIGQQALGLDYFTRQGAMTGAFGPAITLPIFNSSTISSDYKQSAAIFEENVAQYNATLLRALNEVADAATSKQALKKRQEKIREAVTSSERAYRVAQNRYKGGLAAYLEVLTAEDSLIESRRALADIEARAYLLDMAMIRALGGGFNAETLK